MEFYLVLTVEPIIGLMFLKSPRVRIIPAVWYGRLREHLEMKDGFYERGPITAREGVLEARFRRACEEEGIESRSVFRMPDYIYDGRQHMFSRSQDVGVVRQAVDDVPLEI